ncbi:hypothetical protein I4U23_005070 [Adineta vaga]|nr:hypothetical protein I4U23_005070 [Adineta vaga]
MGFFPTILVNDSAGGTGYGSSLIRMSNIWSIYVDNNENIYVGDINNRRVAFWPYNTTQSTIVAGIYNESGNSKVHLNYPRGIFFDKNTSSLFVCDAYNQRIEQFHMISSIGLTVAAENGLGSGPHQLSNPEEGVTIAGTGFPGQDSSMLDTVVGVTLNDNETYLSVTDQNNNTIQRFSLLV